MHSEDLKTLSLLQYLHFKGLLYVLNMQMAFLLFLCGHTETLTVYLWKPVPTGL